MGMSAAETAATTEPVLVFPDPAPADLVQTLDLSGFAWKAVADEVGATRNEPAGGWGGAVICADTDPEGAFALCRALRRRDTPVSPVLLLISGAQLGELELREDLYDDFCLSPFHPRELEARLRHQFWRPEAFRAELARLTSSDALQVQGLPRTLADLTRRIDGLFESIPPR